MKWHTAAASMIVGSFCCLSAYGRLFADDLSIQQAPSKHDNSVGTTSSSAQVGESGSNQNWATKDSQLSDHQGTAPQAINKASSLIGMTVKTQNGEKLGQIKDIVFDQESGSVSYVVLEKADRAKGTGANVAVPLTAFTASSDMKSLTLNIEKDRVEKARGFASDHMPPVGSPVYGARPTDEEMDILIIPEDSDSNLDSGGHRKNHIKNE